jgi:hypothetical protein
MVEEIISALPVSRWPFVSIASCLRLAAGDAA